MAFGLSQGETSWYLATATKSYSKYLELEACRHGGHHLPPSKVHPSSVSVSISVCVCVAEGKQVIGVSKG